MLPVSGAEQLNTSGAQATRPMISHRGAYSRLVSVAAVVLGPPQVPQPLGAGDGLQLLDDAGRHPGVALAPILLDLREEPRFVGVDVLLHEGAHLRLQLLHFVGIGEIHDVLRCFGASPPG